MSQSNDIPEELKTVDTSIYSNLNPTNDIPPDVPEDIEKKPEKLFSTRLIPGLTMWQWKDGAVSKAPLVIQEGKTSKRLDIQPETQYLQAVNRNNAIRKFAKRGFNVKRQEKQ